jgi:hypothetical protein
LIRARRLVIGNRCLKINSISELAVPMLPLFPLFTYAKPYNSSHGSASVFAVVSTAIDDRATLSIGEGSLAIVVIALWIASAVAGWHLFWPWLIVPVAVIGLHVMRVMGSMRAARERNGLTIAGRRGTSMAGANVRLLVFTLVQHAVIFGVAAGVHRILN